MGKNILAWLASVGIGAVGAALLYIEQTINVIPANIEPAVAGLIATIVAWLVGKLVAKLPTA